MAQAGPAIFDVAKALGYRLSRVGLTHAAHWPAPQEILPIKIISHPPNPTGEMEFPDLGW